MISYPLMPVKPASSAAEFPLHPIHFVLCHCTELQQGGQAVSEGLAAPRQFGSVILQCITAGNRLAHLRIRYQHLIGRHASLARAAAQQAQGGDAAQCIGKVPPPGTVVINATGMGKDRPGSPITAAAQFPHNGVAWELNYRGELAFLQQALAQRETRQLTVADGWTAFLHGWTGVIAKVLDIDIDQVTFDRLAVIAASLR